MNAHAILANIIIRRYIWYEHYYQNSTRLDAQHNLIKSFLIDRYNIDHVLKDNLIPNQISTLREQIKNHTFVSTYNFSDNHSNNNDLPYMSLQEILDILSNQMFKYNITINDQLITCNGLVNLNNSIIKQYNITKDLSYVIAIQIDPNSQYEKQALSNINNQILLVNQGSILIFLIVSTISIYLLNKNANTKTQIKKLKLDLTNILLFYKTNKDFTLKCHQYFKTIFTVSNISDAEKYIVSNYQDFPLPLLFLSPKGKNNMYKVDLNSIIPNLENYFIGYNACYNPNVKLKIETSVNELIIPFEQEIFEQIIFSLLANMLFFNKNIEHKKYVRLIFQEDIITCSSDGFSLNQDLIMKYSERIFNDTANIYILSLKQVFHVLKSFQINYFVDRKVSGTEIEIKFNDISALGNDTDIQQKNIIQLEKYLK